MYIERKPARYQFKIPAVISTERNDEMLDDGCISIDTQPKSLPFQAKKETRSV